MGHAPVVALLLFWGCCIDSMDSEGRTVLSVAAAQGKTYLLLMLLLNLLRLFFSLMLLFFHCYHLHSIID